MLSGVLVCWFVCFGGGKRGSSTILLWGLRGRRSQRGQGDVGLWFGLPR